MSTAFLPRKARTLVESVAPFQERVAITFTFLDSSNHSELCSTEIGAGTMADWVIRSMAEWQAASKWGARWAAWRATEPQRAGYASNPQTGVNRMLLDGHSRPTITLWLIVIVTTHAVLNLVPLWLLPESFADSTLQATRTVLELYTDDDSWGPMKDAVDYFYSDPGPGLARIYQHTFFEDRVKFQYPPMALLISSAARWLHADGDRSGYARIGFGFLILAAISTFIVVEMRLAVSGAAQERTVLARSLRLACILFLTFTFRPLVSAFAIGQVQVWLSSMFAIALMLWLAGHPRIVGALVGVMCCVKPQYAFILLWALAAGQWSMAAAGALTSAVLLAISIAIFGVQNHLDYLEVASALSRTGEAFHSNQSVNGLLNRILSVQRPDEFNNLLWRGDHFPPFTPFVYGSTLATSALLLLASLVHGYRSRRLDLTRSFCIAALTCTMASPIAWEHHYGVLFSVYFLLLVDVRRSPLWAGLIAALYLMMANRFSIFDFTAGSYWNFLQSGIFAAGLATLAALYLSPAGVDRTAASLESRPRQAAG